MVRKNLTAPGIKPSILAGIFMTACFLALIPFTDFRGSSIPVFILFFFFASGGYIFGVLRLNRDRLSVLSIFGFAIFFRLILLSTSPSLSEDVYRYVWDGHLLNSGINPYAIPVNAPSLDAFETPLRALVNHNWMASPYLPASQLVFALVEFVFPQNILAFQVTAVIFDLLTGWLVLDILRQLGLPRRNVLIYLWNPLVIIEFAHGAHFDSVMICLMMLAFWFLVKESWQNKTYSVGSVLALAAAVLTKLLPILLVPIFWWRWRWKDRLLFGAILLLALGLFIPGAGLGIGGPLDGTGVFGALRIYFQQWNYNSGIYHWLEVLISGYPTPGSVPVEMVGQTPIYIAKALVSTFLGFAMLLAGWMAWKTEKSDHRIHQSQNLTLIRLAVIPLGGYLLFTTTVHPWYATLIIPFLPFLISKENEFSHLNSFLFPWAYFSLAVTLSYLTYLDPNNLRETTWVRLVEYIPVYGLLIWAFLRAMIESKKMKIKESEI